MAGEESSIEIGTPHTGGYPDNAADPRRRTAPPERETDWRTICQPDRRPSEQSRPRPAATDLQLRPACDLGALATAWVASEPVQDTQVLRSVIAFSHAVYDKRRRERRDGRTVSSVGPPVGAAAWARWEVAFLGSQWTRAFGVKHRRAEAVPGSTGVSLFQPMSTSTLCS